jgi:hypothetical protein
MHSSLNYRRKNFEETRLALLYQSECSENGKKSNAQYQLDDIMKSTSYQIIQ